MPDISTENLDRHLQTAQISHSISHLRFLISSLLILNFYIFCAYHYNFSQDSFYFNLWFFVSEFILSIFWLVNTVYFNPKNHSAKHAHRWIQGICLSIGLLVAAGVVCIYYYLPSLSGNFNYTNALL